MKKLFMLSYMTFTMLLTSCGFLLSPIGEELIVDGAQELVVLEQKLVDSFSHKTPPPVIAVEPLPITP